MPLKDEFGRDATELARMSNEAEGIDEKILLLKIALLLTQLQTNRGIAALTYEMQEFRA